MLISYVVGIYYFFNAFLPLLAWYGWRRVPTRSMDNNSMYFAAWYTLFPLHWFVFVPMAILWPMTYLGEAVIVDFYDIANWWLGSVLAGGVYSFVAFMWFLAYLFYEESDVISRTAIFQEMILYIIVEAFAWYTTVYEYPKAHDWFYYANRTLVNDEETLLPRGSLTSEPARDEQIRPSLKT